MKWKRLRDAPWFRRAAGVALAEYLRLVWRTSRFVLEPADLYERLGPDMPVIITLWHGQHFMAPFLRRRDDRVRALISSHRDGDLNAIAVEHLGSETVRGSGDHGGRFDRKGGVRAFIALRDSIFEGWNLVITADVPKVARQAGRGIVLLARTTGRTIYPVGVATSRRITLDNWDKSAINLPFSRGAIVLGDPIRVPTQADDDVLESCRRAVEASLNAATARAYAIVDGTAEAAALA
jgi:lysophospholipid acyltransferase (LPLAT)-like uncharacterized protein